MYVKYIWVLLVTSGNWVCIDCLLQYVYQQFELKVLDLIQNSYSSAGGFHRSTHEYVGSSSGEYMK